MKSYGHPSPRLAIGGTLRGLLLCGLLLIEFRDARGQASTPRMPQRQTVEGAILYSIEGNVLAPDTRTPVNQALAAANVPTKIHLLMADIYSSAGQMDLAAAELDEFERLDPQSPYMPKVRAARAQLRKPAP